MPTFNHLDKWLAPEIDEINQIHFTRDLMKLTDEEYLNISEIFYSFTTGAAAIARQFQPNQGTAFLLKEVDKIRRLLAGISDYEVFCSFLKQELNICGSYTVNGASADWVNAFQYLHNGPENCLILWQMLNESGRTIELPITDEIFANLGLEENFMSRFYLKANMALQRKQR